MCIITPAIQIKHENPKKIMGPVFNLQGCFQLPFPLLISVAFIQICIYFHLDNLFALLILFCCDILLCTKILNHVGNGMKSLIYLSLILTTTFICDRAVC